jgi:hypothetical protein
MIFGKLFSRKSKHKLIDSDSIITSHDVIITLQNKLSKLEYELTQLREKCSNNFDNFDKFEELYKQLLEIKNIDVNIDDDY